MLKAALNLAFDEGHVGNRDAWGRKLKPFRDVEVARVRYLTSCRHSGSSTRRTRFPPAGARGLETGCRYGELTRLEVADFNPDAGTLAVASAKAASRAMSC